jgi:hypothetical protein
MSHFSAMLDALARAVQRLADGGGPFWDADAAAKVAAARSAAAESETTQPVPVPTVPTEPYQSAPKKC